jgi:hypothetical protein
MSENIDIVLRARDQALSSLREVRQELERTNQTQKISRENYKEIRKELIDNNRYLKTLEMSYRDQTQTLELTGKAFQSVSSAIGKAQTMYTQYNVAMIKTNQLQKEVKDEQEKYNQAVAKFGAGSAEARKAQEELAESTQKLAQAQQQNTLQMVGFVGQIPGLLKGVLDIRTHFLVLAKHLGDMDWSGWASRAVTAIGGVQLALGTLALVLGTVVAVVGTAVVSWTQIHVPFQKVIEGANLTTREYQALMRAVSESGMSIDQFGEKLKQGQIVLADWTEYGEFATSAVQKLIDTYKKLQQTPPPATATQTTQTQELARTLKEMEDRLKSLTQAYKDGKIGADEYIPRAKDLSDEIKRIKETIALATDTTAKYDDVLEDLGGSISKTTRTKSGFESNLVTLNGVMGNSIVIASNFSSVLGNLGGAIQQAASFNLPGGMLTFGGGGISPMLSPSQWGGLGSWAGGALSTAASIQPQGMLSTAAQAVAPMVQAMQPGGSLQTWSQQALAVGAQTATQMTGAMGGLSNIPVVQAMLAGAGYEPPPAAPSPAPSLSSIFQPVTNALSSIASSVSSLFTYIPPPPTYIPPPEMQEGGIVTRPLRALIGEAGPEAVIPLNKLGSSPTSNVFNVTMHVASLSMNQAELRRFWNELEENLSRAVMRKG